MQLGKSRSKSSKPGFFGHILKYVFSVAVLTALVLGVTLGAKEFYNFDSKRFGLFASGLLAKAHINASGDQIGEVAGDFVERISQTNLGSGVSVSRKETDTVSSSTPSPREVLFKVAVFADIHEDTDNLARAVNLAKNNDASVIFDLGDSTNYGDIASLRTIRDQLKASGTEFYAIPGDHDLAAAAQDDVDPYKYFKDVFGQDSQVVSIQGYNFLLLDNSANFTPILPETISWLERSAPSVDFVLLSQPLYAEGLTNYPILKKSYMGSTWEEVTDSVKKEQQTAVRDQGSLILSLIQNSTKIKAVIAGDHHFSSKSVDPKRNDLTHYVTGAITSTYGEYSQNALQSPRFSLMTVFADGSYKIEDIVLD